MQAKEVKPFLGKGIRKTSTAELVRKLNDLFGLTIKKLKLSARIVQELERRGYDITILNRGSFWMRSLRRIASGELLPEVVQLFYSTPDLAESIGRLPIAQQRELIESGKVDVLIGDKMESMELGRLNRQSIMIAFASDHIRTEAEQRQMFSRPAIADKPVVEQPERREHSFRVRPVPEKNGYEVGKMFVPAEEIVQAQAAAIAGGKIPEVNPDSDETMTFRVLSWEKEAINSLSKQTGKNAWLLIREAVWAQYGVVLNRHKPK